MDDRARRGHQEAFGDWLRAQLANHGLTMTELAERMGVSQASVSRWISNQRHPEHDSLERLAVILDVPVDVVLERAGRRRFPDERIAALLEEQASIEVEARKLQDRIVAIAVRSREIAAEIQRIEQARGVDLPLLDRLLEAIGDVPLDDPTREILHQRITEVIRKQPKGGNPTSPPTRVDAV